MPLSLTKQYYKHFLLLCFFAIATGALYAQQQVRLELVALDVEQTVLEEKLEYEKLLPDSLSVIDQLKSIVLQLHGQAHLEASIDSVTQTDTLFIAQVHVGKAYQWAELRNGNVDEAFLSQVGFRERLYRKKPFHYKEVLDLQESLLK